MIIETHELSFQFNKYHKLLDKVSIQVPEKSIYGFLGPNGAGKSTTIRLITGLLGEQNPGQISLFGKPLEEQLPFAFSQIGCIIETPTLYGHLTGLEHLKFVAKLQNTDESKFNEVLDLVGLDHAKNIKSKKYSLGMKQRLSIAMALINDPKLLILDEPVNGLDPQGIIEMRLLLQKLNREKGITIFISSHILAEVEKLCTHVGILYNGILQFQGTMSDLKAKNSHASILVEVGNLDQHLNLIKQNYDDCVQISENEIQLKFSSKEEIPTFVNFLAQHNVSVYKIQPQGGLEEWFIDLTKQIKTL
ncbi:ABC-2 type transport system ATP-binding protein [Paenimyroides ummariense]|uniref:ABC-2 type transport system ATP-binding protein n=1 Tax=Paenimyroides ummariense TaxID=913024 RepID=A0A1I5GF83_9FLAO|nr:ABC transporter ATP-binding protein [Paenimyroides ummariense]SFO34211.1 ABC-2 type transport system ATP-binding protein [Paenimyroides ummariense]